MEIALPIIFVAIMGAAMLAYVILDGYDLGVGILLPLASDQDKDIMIASIGPFWDANETWIVLGIGVLLIAFPKAHGVILSALYIPVTLMLFGLILRGVAFDFRVKAGDQKKHVWNRVFFYGSLLSALCQGWMLGAYITGLSTSPINLVFSALIAVTLPAAYILLGSGWLMIKTEGELFLLAKKWGKLAVWPMGVALILVSIATPIVNQAIADRWFTLPNAIGLLPIPLSCSIAYGVILWSLYSEKVNEENGRLLVFMATMLICVMSALGLAYSIYPDIVIGQITIFEAAAATESLQIVLVGMAITLPAIIVYTIIVYRIFSGPAKPLTYE